ncbi:MAG: hypothetical protein ACOYH4_01985 [Saccharofermentanales bacterium]|jgi:hypothetical protein
MRIKIIANDTQHKRIHLAVPNRIAVYILAKRRHISDDSEYSLDIDDLPKEARRQVLHALNKMKRKHRGLPLVEVLTAEGECVRIMP